MAAEDAPVVIDAGSELSAATAARLRATVTDAVVRGRTTIHLQLGKVVSYDAAGLGLLVGLRRLIDAADGRLVCVDPSPPVLSGLRRLGLHRVLDLQLEVPEQQASGPAGADAGRAAGG